MANLISFMPYVSSIPTLTVKLKIVFSIYSASMSIAICISNFNYKPLRTKQPHVHGAAAVWVQEGWEELLHIQSQEGRLWGGTSPRR